MYTWCNIHIHAVSHYGNSPSFPNQILQHAHYTSHHTETTIKTVHVVLCTRIHMYKTLLHSLTDNKRTYVYVYMHRHMNCVCTCSREYLPTLPPFSHQEVTHYDNTADVLSQRTEKPTFYTQRLSNDTQPAPWHISPKRETPVYTQLVLAQCIHSPCILVAGADMARHTNSGCLLRKYADLPVSV